MALRWREPIHLRRALDKEGYPDCLSPMPSRASTIATSLAACVLMIGGVWTWAGVLGVGLVVTALGLLVGLCIPWCERLTHRSILINPEGITVFGSTTASLAGFFGGHIDRYSIDSIRSVSLEHVDIRGTTFPTIVVDLHDDTVIAVGLRQDQTPSKIRHRLKEWGYSFVGSTAG